MYHIEIKRSALKEMSWLPQNIHHQLIQSIEALKSNPYPFGSKKLAGSTNRWRIRVGDYRILYTVNDTTKQILIYRIIH